MNQSATSFRFSLELVAMVAVIAISSWHVGNYMNTFDGWLMAAIMGATLGFCNFLMAHNIFKPNSTSRVPSFCGLIFFACTSTYMQYTYFNADPNIGKTMLVSINMDALALGVWAPAAEILLGWIYAAGLKQPTTTVRSNERQISKFERLTEALTNKLEQQLKASKSPSGGSIEKVPSVGLNGNTSVVGVHLHNSAKDSGPNVNTETVYSNGEMNSRIDHGRLSKEEALERVLNIYRSNPDASYEEIGRAIGRSKGTVANYVKKLKEEQRITESDDFAKKRVA